MKLEDIKKIGVAGAGTMGAGIAQIFAIKGYDVVVTDIAEKFLENAKKIISINNSSLIDEKIITESDAENTINNIFFTTDTEAFADVDVIIEAIIEKMDIKQDYWKEVEEIAKEDAIFATNTSGLSITEICKKINNKGRFVGMHWWNPPHIIPLIEVIRGEETDDETVDTLVELVKKIDREPVVVQKDANGFIGNRIQFAIFREALNIVEQGIATVEDVDRAMKYGLGFRYASIGPFETADLGGLDTFYYISSYLWNEISDAKEPADTLKTLVNNNNLGVKTGKGFYDYSDGKDKEAMKRRDKAFYKTLRELHMKTLKDDLF